MRELYEHTPFNQRLVPARFADAWMSEIFIPENNNDTVIRYLNYNPNFSIDENRELALKKANLWREFGQYEGLRIPDFHIVMGDEGEGKGRPTF